MKRHGQKEITMHHPLIHLSTILSLSSHFAYAIILYSVGPISLETLQFATAVFLKHFHYIKISLGYKKVQKTKVS